MTMMSSVISSVLSLSAVFVFGGEVPRRQVAILRKDTRPQTRSKVLFSMLCVTVRYWRGG